MPRFAIDDWMAGQFRLTTFVTSRVEGNPENLWESVVGSPPDEANASPKKGISQVSGSFEPGKLTLRLEGQRVDWIIEPESIDPATLSSDLSLVSTDQFFSLGSWVQGIAVFERIADSWLSQPLPQVERIAFGSVLFHSEVSKAAAYERLADYIPVAPSVGSSDFLYQINHPTASATGADELQVNRLTKWSVGAFRAFGLTLGPKGYSAVQHEPAIALRLELDINTAPGPASLIPQDRLLDLYKELVGFGRQIAAEGLQQT
jgi:hypothetical protein